jgi:uncharacterized membrane protein YkvA (DUF1232 family)
LSFDPKKTLQSLIESIKPKLGDESYLKQVSQDAQKKLSKLQEHSKIPEEANTFFRMLRAFANRTYRDIDTKSILLVIASLVYFINPFDLVHDYIPFTGLVDDAALFTFVITQLRQEIDKFLKWESTSSETSE